MTSKKDLQELSDWMNGYADGAGIDKLQRVAKALREMANCVCDQGIPGCYINRCTSDHK